MWAPEFTGLDGRAEIAERIGEGLDEWFRHRAGAAAFHAGRRPFAVFAYRGELTDHGIGAPMSAADRSSSRILNCQSFSASRRAMSSVSV